VAYCAHVHGPHTISPYTVDSRIRASEVSFDRDCWAYSFEANCGEHKASIWAS
jgi:hypothetical protein